MSMAFYVNCTIYYATILGLHRETQHHFDVWKKSKHVGIEWKLLSESDQKTEKT